MLFYLIAENEFLTLCEHVQPFFISFTTPFFGWIFLMKLENSTDLLIKTKTFKFSFPNSR